MTFERRTAPLGVRSREDEMLCYCCAKTIVLTCCSPVSHLILAWHSLVQAQFPPTPEGVTVLESRFGDGVKISYKEVRVTMQQYSILLTCDLSSLVSVRQRLV